MSTVTSIQVIIFLKDIIVEYYFQHAVDITPQFAEHGELVINVGYIRDIAFLCASQQYFWHQKINEKMIFYDWVCTLKIMMTIIILFVYVKEHLPHQH